MREREACVAAVNYNSTALHNMLWKPSRTFCMIVRIPSLSVLNRRSCEKVVTQLLEASMAQHCKSAQTLR